MGNILLVVSWVQAHGQDIFAALGYLYAAGLIIVRLTPTKADDEFLQKVYDKVHGLVGVLGVKK